MSETQESNFKALDISIRTQKKLLSRMANKNIAKVFIDDISADLLDNLYLLAKTRGNKRNAEKVIKNIIKMVIKIGILYRNDQFSEKELQTADDFRSKFHKVGLTVISYYEVEHSYDRVFLTDLIGQCSTLLKDLVRRLLTEKSLGRIDHIFNFFVDPQFFDDVFNKRSEQKEIMDKIVGDLNKLVDSGNL